MREDAPERNWLNAPTLRRTGLCLMAGLLAGLTGCATTIDVPLARRTEGLPSANRGQSSAAVFSEPPVAAVMAQTPDWMRPEFARNNETLAYANPRALTAIDEWPQVPPPTIMSQRRTTFSSSSRQVIIFSSPGARRGGAYGPRGPRSGPVRNRGARHLHSPRPR